MASGDDGTAWGTETETLGIRGDRIQGTVNIVEGASLGIGVLSLPVFVVFDLQIETDVVEQKVQEYQQEVPDDEGDTWDKCEQVVSDADKYWVSDGRDLCHDERYKGICQGETVVLQVVHKEGEGSQQVQMSLAQVLQVAK